LKKKLRKRRGAVNCFKKKCRPLPGGILIHAAPHLLLVYYFQTYMKSKRYTYVFLLLMVLSFFHTQFLSAQDPDENPLQFTDEESLFPEYEVEQLNKPPEGVDTVFPVIFNGSLYSFSLGISKPIWKIFIGGDILNPFVVQDGNVYFYDIYNRMYAIDLKNGKVLWVSLIKNEISGKPLIYENFIIISTLDGGIYVLIRSDGHLLYSYENEDEINAGLKIYENLLIVPYKSGKVVAYDMVSRKQVWVFSAGGIISVSPVLRDDNLYFGAWDGTFYSLDIKTGKSIWISYVGNNITRDFLVFDNVIVLFFSKGEVVCLNRENGSIKWIKYFSTVDFNYNYFSGEKALYVFLPDFIAIDPISGGMLFDYRERAFNLYKEMLFDNMVEGKNPLSDKDRIRLLSDVYFTVDAFPYLPPGKAGKNLVYFITGNAYLCVYDLLKDFFILKYKMS